MSIQRIVTVVELKCSKSAGSLEPTLTKFTPTECHTIWSYYNTTYYAVVVKIILVWLMLHYNKKYTYLLNWYACANTSLTQRCVPKSAQSITIFQSPCVKFITDKQISTTQLTAYPGTSPFVKGLVSEGLTDCNHWLHWTSVDQPEFCPVREGAKLITLHVYKRYDFKWQTTWATLQWNQDVSC